eukprot:gnl/Chilomastix_cuspidata/545.p1 GENE.gnl/Chilomastix_cuspidata/545~~gnl/Chilomastix_cuspidata/545.p1  ORF type:complete len:1234 (-),score=683.63 gnl/Chilomastix_cuspidata/545:185-3886(-)
MAIDLSKITRVEDIPAGLPKKEREKIKKRIKKLQESGKGGKKPAAAPARAGRAGARKPPPRGRKPPAAASVPKGGAKGQAAKPGPSKKLLEAQKRAEKRRRAIEEQKRKEEEEARQLEEERKRAEREERERKEREERRKAELAERKRKAKEREDYMRAQGILPKNARQQQKLARQREILGVTAVSRDIDAEMSMSKDALARAKAERLRQADEAHKQKILRKQEEKRRAREAEEQQKQEEIAQVIQETEKKHSAYAGINWEGSESSDSDGFQMSCAESDDISSSEAPAFEPSADGSSSEFVPSFSEETVEEEPRVQAPAAPALPPGLRAPIATILGHVDTGKCFARGTPVLLANGRAAPIESISPGDHVLGPDSAVRRVERTASGTDAMFRVTPADTSFMAFTVNAPHVLVYSIDCTPALRVAPDAVEVEFFVRREEEKPRAPDTQVETKVWAQRERRAFMAADEAKKFVDDLEAGRGPAGALLGRQVFETEARDFVRFPAETKAAARLFAPAAVSFPEADAARAETVLGCSPGSLASDAVDAMLAQAEAASPDAANDIFTALLAAPLPFRQQFVSAYLAARSFSVSAVPPPLALLAHSVGARFAATEGAFAARLPRPGAFVEAAFAVAPAGTDEYFGFSLSGADSLFLLGDCTVVHNTKILDKIRSSNVQDKEAGGITQQIGATFFPIEFLERKMEGLPFDFERKLPGLLVIDTPGHEAFANLRSRGSSLCDIAILVVDIMHGLEPQTLESLSLLRARKTPFIIALNKIDRLTNWAAIPNTPSVNRVRTLSGITKHHFDERWASVQKQLGLEGFSSELYWKNRDISSQISVVPTSAHTGEGMPDLLAVLVQLTQKHMKRSLQDDKEDFSCTVLEVKVIEGLGTTIDAILVSGSIRRGDTIVLCGLQGTIVTVVKALLMPKEATELRVKSDFIDNEVIHAAQGFKIVASGLEHAVAGSRLVVAHTEDEIEDAKFDVARDFEDIQKRIERNPEGILAQASTLGSLEALLAFLKTVKIPVSSIALGPIFKSSVQKASLQREKGKPEYAIILGFDVKVDAEAQLEAKELGVEIFTADIIYHLEESFKKHLKAEEDRRRREHMSRAIFPVQMTYLPGHTIHQMDPVIIGVRIDDGFLVPGTPLIDATQGRLVLGVVETIQRNLKTVERANAGDEVAVKIAPAKANLMATRHFFEGDVIYSNMTRASIDILKEFFRDEAFMKKSDWRLVIRIKKLLGIQ